MQTSSIVGATSRRRQVGTTNTAVSELPLTLL